MNKKTNILVRVDSTNDMGIGHVMRCIALSQHCQDLGLRVWFASCSQLDEIQTLIQNEGFQHHLFSSKKGSLNDAEQTLALADMISANKIILDGYHFSKSYIEKLSSNGKKVVIFSDADLISEKVDAVINQNLYAHSSQYPSNIKQFLGLEHLLLRKEFRQYKDFERMRINTVNKLLITLGGADPNNVSMQIVEILERYRQRRLAITIILGAGYLYHEQIKRITQSCFHEYTFAENVKNISDYMKNADIGLTAGGSTCWELIVMQLPSIIVTLSENQERVAQTMTSFGYGVSVGWYDATFFENTLLNELDRMVSNPNRVNEFISKMKEIQVASLAFQIAEYLSLT